MNTTNVIYYFAPFLPLVTRFILCVKWRKYMSEQLPEAAQERDVQRGFILSLAGFSFTAIAGLAVVDSTTRVGLQLPSWYVLLSFVAFFTSLSFQSYKFSRGHNQFAMALIEAGTFSLMLSLVALLYTAKFDPTFQMIAAGFTLVPWLIDHAYRLSIDWNYLADLESPHP